MSSWWKPKFDLVVVLFQRPHLRDEGLQMEAYFGMGILESMFDKMEQRPGIEDLVLSFPERWLNIVEQRQLLERIEKYLPDIKRVDIKTHSPFIIQCTPNECARVVADKGDIDDNDLSARLYGETVMRFMKPDGLNVLRGGEG